MENNMEVRPLQPKDEFSILYISSAHGDDEFFFFIQDLMEEAAESGEDQNYAYGVFENGRLVGYCTIDDNAENETAANEIYLGDIYILNEDRHKGYGTYLLQEVLKLCEGRTVLVNLSAEYEEGLVGFLEGLGFTAKTSDMLLKTL